MWLYHSYDPSQSENSILFALKSWISMKPHTSYMQKNYKRELPGKENSPKPRLLWLVINRIESSFRIENSKEKPKSQLQESGNKQTSKGHGWNSATEAAISWFLQDTQIKQETLFQSPTVSEQPIMQDSKKDKLLHESWCEKLSTWEGVWLGRSNSTP